MIFNFTREAVSPLIVSLEIINATVDLKVSCVDYISSLVTSVSPNLIAAINIIKFQDIHGKSCEINVILRYFRYCFIFLAPELGIVKELFGENNVAAFLRYQENMYNESKYGPNVTPNVSIKVTPQATVISNGTHFELFLLYDTVYNISSYIRVCEFTGPSTTDELFYGK